MNDTKIAIFTGASHIPAKETVYDPFSLQWPELNRTDRRLRAVVGEAAEKRNAKKSTRRYRTACARHMPTWLTRTLSPSSRDELPVDECRERRLAYVPGSLLAGRGVLPQPAVGDASMKMVVNGGSGLICGDWHGP
jgi:hypothetical protein